MIGAPFLRIARINGFLEIDDLLVGHNVVDIEEATSEAS